jgi:plastocyanin
MKFIIRFVLPVLFFSVSYNFAQTLHDVALVGNTFSPADLTINVADTVRWTNNGGFHDVTADDNSFSSGSPSNAIWVFIHVFDTQGDFRYYCSVHGAPGGVGMAGIIHVESATDVSEDAAKIDFVLKQNYPNPFNPSTTIQYSIPQNEYVTLKVYNVTGALVKELIPGYQPGGNYIVEFNATDLASGMYFYQLTAGNFVSTKRMILLK